MITRIILITKKGKLTISHRYNHLPLLPSGPGGFNGSWSYRTYPYHCCGADGSRTRVQTRNKYAFYMLIRLLFFGRWPATGSLPTHYPLICHCGDEAAPQLFPSHERLRIANRGTGFAGNVLSNTLCRIKLIYYDSIRLQERKYFRHFLFCDPDLRDISRGSACLQYPFTLLSKPNSPFNLYCL